MPRTARKSARAAATSASRTEAAGRFRAMYTRAEAGHLEEALLDIRSHTPRRTALAILMHDAEALVRCYGETPEALESLMQQGDEIDGYLANQRELLELLDTARKRLEIVVERITNARPELLSGRMPVSDWPPL
jgi:hypothetical protein